MSINKVLAAAVAIAAVSPAFAAPHLNANQKAAGCSILDGHVFCSSPGTGMCWKQGHDPNLGQPAEAIDVGTDPAPGVDERLCSGWTDAVSFRMVNGAIHVMVEVGSWRMGMGTEDMILDTGANRSVISVSGARRLIASRFARRGPTVIVRLAGGSTVAQRSIIVDQMRLGVHVLHNVPMNVVPDGVDMLLGLPILTAIGKLSIDFGQGVLRFD
jgi:hypothetical protein